MQQEIIELMCLPAIDFASKLLPHRQPFKIEKKIKENKRKPRRFFKNQNETGGKKDFPSLKGNMGT